MTVRQNEETSPSDEPATGVDAAEKKAKKKTSKKKSKNDVNVVDDDDDSDGDDDKVVKTPKKKKSIKKKKSSSKKSIDPDGTAEAADDERPKSPKKKKSKKSITRDEDDNAKANGGGGDEDVKFHNVDLEMGGGVGKSAEFEKRTKGFQAKGRQSSMLAASDDPFAAREGKTLIWRNINMTLKAKGRDVEDRPLLRDVWGEVPEQQTTAIMGPSGAGKSEFCRLFAPIVQLLWEIRNGMCCAF